MIRFENTDVVGWEAAIPEPADKEEIKRREQL